MTARAVLALADGTVLRGQSIGADGAADGEVVFNTSMTGYQEILTDPSYCRQVVTLTYPHIGNVGCNGEDEEAACVHASGLVVRDAPRVSSSWRARGSLREFLRERGVVAIAGVDTRHLARVIRERGAQAGCLVAGEEIDEEKALAQARGFPGLEGMDLAEVVSTSRRYTWEEGAWRIGDGGGFASAPEARAHVVAYDFGVKRNILRLLVDQGCRVTVVPARTAAAEVLDLQPDGVFLSNGPGDPEPCGYAIAAIAELLDTGIPLFGICLGHQLLALACGARTTKMKVGHHGANHPVQALHTGQVLITSQNHGFAVDETDLPGNVRITHRSLFDGTVQGIELVDRPAFGFQGHPEASPGPRDAAGLFDRFVELIDASRRGGRLTG